MLRLPKAILPKWRYWPAIPFAGLIALAICGYVLFPPHPVPQQHQTAKPTSKEEIRPEIFSTLVSLTAEQVIAIFTGLTALIFLGQLFTMRRANEHFRVGERAYVSAIPQNMVLKPDGETYIAIVDLANTGKTPAFQAQSSVDMRVMDYPRKRPFLFNRTDDGSPVPTFVVFPNGGHITVTEKLLDATEREKLSNGRHALYVFGVVNFVDAFDRPQWTEFCVVLDGPSHDEWLCKARQEPFGVEVPARFKFTEMNNRASQN